MKQYFSFFFIIIPFIASTQVVEELIQIDTITEVIRVIYKPSVSTTYYTKKSAVFADDTSQVAIEKSYVKGAQSGVYKAFYPNGQLKIKTVFAKNKLNGEWVYYDSNGIIITKGNYEKGVKHGYWAYKSLKIYGRYYKGLKSWRWHKINHNKKRVKSTYKKGVLIRGEGFGEERVSISSDTSKTTKSISTKEDETLISKEYKQAISFLSENLIFKKAFKEHFSKGNFKKIRKLKKHFFRERFQFVIAPTTYLLDESLFYEDLVNEKIKVSVIDSLLRYSAKEVLMSDHSPVFKVGDKLNEYPFESYSTNLKSPITIMFGELGEMKNGLMRIDVVLNEDNKKRRFQVLLYFNNEGELRGAEYENP